MKTTATTYRVMIVDDEVILRAGIVHLCDWSQYGIEIVAEASNGQEALTLIETCSPHVVITDIMMPVMDGIEFTKMMKKLYPHIKVVVLSSYSEFSYVREVFKYGVTDYLLKPTVSAEELITLIQTLCSDLSPAKLTVEPIKYDRSLVLNQWLQHDGTMDATALTELSLQFPASKFHMIKASTSLILMRTSYTQSQLEQMILDIAKDRLASLHYSVVFLKNELVVLFNYEEDQYVFMEDSIQAFAEQVQETFTYIIFISSAVFDQFDDILIQHEQLTPYLGKLFYFPHKAVVVQREINLDSDKVEFDLNSFTTMLRILALDDAYTHLKAFFYEVTQVQAYDDYSLKRICQNIVYTATSTMEQYKRHESSGSSSKLKRFKNIDLANDIEELEHIMSQFIDELKAMTPQVDHQQSMLLQQIYEYVHHNYANEISLTEMANHLHMNYSYLSSYFKQRTGENLTTYINRVRIDQAKHLLSNLDYSVSEVSRMTGFSEHNYFSKVFKKMTGLTPLEYRNHTFHS